MKRYFLLIAVMLIILPEYSEAQVGKFLKNVKNAVVDDLLGTDNNSAKPAPEPSCACDGADFIIDMDKFKLDYTECNINNLADGQILILDRLTLRYYIVKDGVTEGPVRPEDPRVKPFRETMENDEYQTGIEQLYREYISRKGDKYTITFAGKTYGPYGRIDRFAVTRSKDKFAASVMENIIVTENEGEAMEKAIENAKTDQEKMELAMKFGMQMQEKILSGGGTSSVTPKLISNIPITGDDQAALYSGIFTATMKYDDILICKPDRITDLTGNTIIKIPVGSYDPEKTFISSDNKKYAVFNYGTLTISDGKTLTDLFNPYLLKQDGRIYLTYMYFSPKRNAIMQCKIPF